MFKYYITDVNTYMWEKEISEKEFDEIIAESEINHTGYTVYDAEEKLFMVQDDETKDTWDDEQIIIAAYKEDGKWFEVPTIFRNMIINFKID